MTSARRNESGPFGQVLTATDGRDILENTPDGWEVDQPYLWWDGPAGGDGTGGPWGNPPPGADAAAPSLYGLSLPVVTRCTQLIAESIAGMPWKVYRGRERIDAPRWISDPQQQRVDGRIPGTDLLLPVRFSNVEFWAQAITSYLWWGEAILYTPRLRDDAGEPTGPIQTPLYVLHPEAVDLDDSGCWVVTDDDTGDEYTLDPRELIIVRNIVRPGRKRGLGVIGAHAANLGFYGNVRRYADNLFQRGVPGGYLKSSKPDLDEATARTVKDKWMRAHGADRKSIAVLNATTEFVPLQLDPQTTQFLDMKRLEAWEVAQMFGIPPAKLGVSMGESLTYSNLESDNAAFVQNALLPVARKFEAALDAQLPYGNELKIDFRSIDRGDTSARYAAYSTGIASGFLTVDEVRAFEDLPPLAPVDLVAGDTSQDTSQDTTPPAVDGGDAPPLALVQ